MLGDTLAEEWLQTSLPSPPQEAQALEAVTKEGDTILCRQLPLDCSFANTQGKGHRTAPSHCVEKLRSCSRQFPWGVFLGQQCLHEHPLEKSEDIQVLHGLYVSESRTKHTKAVTGQRQQPRLIRRGRNIRHKLGDAMLILNISNGNVEEKKGIFHIVLFREEQTDFDGWTQS